MRNADDLNDLRFVAAVAHAGTLAGAARALGVSQATAYRRLHAIEAGLGVRLFERSTGRYVPTAAGEEVARAGAELVDAAQAVVRRLAGQDLRPHGTVRIATTDMLAAALLLPLLGALRQAYPEILLRITTGNDFLNLSRRDADLALRASPRPPEHLVGMRVGDMASAVYGTSPLAADVDRAGGMDGFPWIALDESASGSLAVRWLAARVPLDAVALRFNTMAAVRQACVAGLGLAVLPCFVGDAEPALRRIGAPLAECASALWLLTHPDLRETVRVKAVLQWLHAALAPARDRLAGRA
ncbi:LysR family transcriptional regulator [Pseudorhodoferax sp.]|uniref:LysR family transcriptional regulator n=1 Tax=Pseudorhodoferax sp. TaxID=1993553 RepID=UPI002DD64DD6|nr:LysR family transcriptional regulator [Pseudorhodoferax sp.]